MTSQVKRLSALGTDFEAYALTIGEGVNCKIARITILKSEMLEWIESKNHGWIQARVRLVD